MLAIRTKPVETLLFRSELVAVGKFRCPVSHPLYRDSGPCTHHTIVFPRTMTALRHAGGPSFLGTPNSVSFYNEQQVYFREPISEIGASDWYVLAEDVLRDAIALFDPAVSDRPARPFPFAAGPSDRRSYLEQRALFEQLEDGGDADPIAVEESVLAIAGRVIASAFSTRAPLSPSLGEAVEETKRCIIREPRRNTSLRELAAAAGSSPFHLCRAFSRSTGTTITAFRHSLRVRLALERLRVPVDLTDLALDLGYSSHSHFTHVFRRYFGITPSAWAQSRDSRRRSRVATLRA